MLRVRVSTDALRPAGASRDQGSASLEFIAVGVVLLVPIIYLIVALGAVQAQALGVDTGARQIARAIASAPDAATADARAELVRDAIVDEYDLDPAFVEVSVSCGESAVCPDAGALLTVTVTSSAPLPLVPAVLGLERVTRVPVQSTSVQKVSQYWGVTP